MSCGLGSHSRPSVKFLSCEWLLTLELRRWTPGNVKLLLPPRPGGLPLTLVRITPGRTISGADVQALCLPAGGDVAKLLQSRPHKDGASCGARPQSTRLVQTESHPPRRARARRRVGWRSCSREPEPRWRRGRKWPSVLRSWLTPKSLRDPRRRRLRRVLSRQADAARSAGARRP